MKKMCNQENKSQKLTPDLDKNLILIKEVLGTSSDVVIRRFKVGFNQCEAFLLYIDGLANQTFVSESIMKSLMLETPLIKKAFPYNKRLAAQIKESLLTVGEIQEEAELDTVLSLVLSGDTALCLEGSDQSLIISTKGFENRGVTEPATETVIRGPREGFSESLRINTSLIRRKIKNPNLRLEQQKIGRQTQTEICIAYIKGICNEETVTELKKRLSRIDTDAILESGYIESFIEDEPYSLFPTIGNTEKPDAVAAKILEGRIAVIVDGTPMVLTLPYLFVEAFQSSEDYYSRIYYANIIRWIRYISFFLTAYLPSLNIAITTFHQEMLPTPLLLTMAAAREGTPFPALVEAIGMGLIFEILREAGVRMPRPIGQAVSIVGALVIGETAVSAGLIGAPMVIVVALTAITSFVVPALSNLATILRLTLTIFAGVTGLYGLMLITIILLVHMVGLRSFGVPYLSPLAPLTLSDLKDVIIRVPHWAMLTRPKATGYNNWKRQSYALKPVPPPIKEE